MIIETTIVTQYAKPYNQLYSKNDYFAIGYDSDKLVKLFTPEDEPLTGGTYIGSLLNGFGATTYLQLMTEAKKRGLKFDG